MKNKGCIRVRRVTDQCKWILNLHLCKSLWIYSWHIMLYSLCDVLEFQKEHVVEQTILYAMLKSEFTHQKWDVQQHNQVSTVNVGEKYGSPILNNLSCVPNGVLIECMYCTPHWWVSGKIALMHQQYGCLILFYSRRQWSCCFEKHNLWRVLLQYWMPHFV